MVPIVSVSEQLKNACVRNVCLRIYFSNSLRDRRHDTGSHCKVPHTTTGRYRANVVGDEPGRDQGGLPPDRAYKKDLVRDH